MSNNNGNTPAMPFVDSGFGQYKPEAFAGMTKLETFAMNAPDCPKWFRMSFISNNKGYTMYNTSTGHNDKLSNNGEMALIKSWRYAYAELMTSELSK